MSMKRNIASLLLSAALVLNMGLPVFALEKKEAHTEASGVFALTPEKEGAGTAGRSTSALEVNDKAEIGGAVDGAWYCFTKDLIISDGEYTKITIDGVEVTPVNGKITVTAKDTQQAIVATDDAGNTTRILIRVNPRHAPEMDDDDCTTEVLCSVCGEVAIEAKAHDYQSSWTIDGDMHWHRCKNEGCNVKDSYAKHTPREDDGNCATSIACSSCGSVIVNAKQHNFATEWTTDGTSHWKECQNDGCVVKGELGAHTPNADDGDCTTAVTCSACGTLTTAAKAHQYKTEWSSDGASHWRDCQNAGCTGKGDLSAHTLNADDGDCTTADACSVCGAVITAAKAHDFSTEWTTDGVSHWHACKNAGCAVVSDKASHSGGAANCHAKAICSTCDVEYGSVDALRHDGETEIKNAASATHTAPGYTGDTYCKGCGEKLEAGEETPVIDHVYGEWQKNNADTHERICDCGAVEQQAHQWDGGKITAEPSIETQGVKTYICTVCGETETEVIAKLPAPVAEPEIPQTGESTPVLAVAALMLLSGGGAFLLRKKREQR